MPNFYIWFDTISGHGFPKTVSIQVVSQSYLDNNTDWEFNDWLEYHQAIPLESEPFFKGMFESFLADVPNEIKITLEMKLASLPQFTHRLF